MKRVLMATALPLILTACDEAALSGGAGTSGVATAAPNEAEQACLAAVTRQSNNPDVVLMGSEFSQAGTYVRVGVGANRAPWKCIVYSDGTVAGVESLASEGRL